VQTRLTDVLGIEHPAMLAGMGGVSYHRLVAAVSAAGGFGCLGASVMSNEQLVEEIEATRALTDLPFGVDLLTAMPNNLLHQVELLIEHGASVFVAGLGVPSEAIDLCHRHGVLVANMCGKVTHARTAVDAGCDLVIAQGTEAGGHTGQVATMPLVPQIVDAVGDRVPVVAACGLYDGSGLAAALSLGADGVWLGTRFIATPEARTVAGYKERLTTAAEDGTVITRAYSGKTMRVLRNSYLDDWEKSGAEVQKFPMQAISAMRDGVFHLGGDESTTGVDPERECYPAGQGVGGIAGLEPAGDVVRRVVREAEEVLARLASGTVGASATMET
jgi:enoyl-[acyl-carrier protein] reductase II